MRVPWTTMSSRNASEMDATNETRGGLAAVARCTLRASACPPQPAITGLNVRGGARSSFRRNPSCFPPHPRLCLSNLEHGFRPGRSRTCGANVCARLFVAPKYQLIPSPGSTTRDTRTGMPTAAYTVSLKAAHWVEKKDTKCGKSSDFTKALLACGPPFSRRRVAETSTPSHFIAKLHAFNRHSRTASNIKHLLDLIAQFPKINPSAAGPSDLDIPKLFRQIRSRYKALCATLGVRPTLRAGGPAGSQDGLDDPADSPTGTSTQESKPVWKIDNKHMARSNNDLSF